MSLVLEWVVLLVAILTCGLLGLGLLRLASGTAGSFAQATNSDTDTTRFTVLGVAGMSAVMGSIASCVYFNFNAAGSMEISLQESYGLTPFQVNCMVSVYSLAGFVAPLFVDSAIERFSLKYAGALSVITVGVGGLVFAAAQTLNADFIFPVMLLGRTCIGLGTATLVISRTAATRWFAGGPHLSLAYGVILVLEQSVGSSLPFLILNQSGSVVFDSVVSVWISSFSFLMLGIYAVFERRYRPAGDACITHKNESCRSSKAFTENMRLCIHSLKQFSSLFWLQCFAHLANVTVLYVSANTFPFYFMHDFGMDQKKAGWCTAIIYTCTILAPGAGSFSDRFGQRLTVQLVFSTVAFATFLILCAGGANPYLSMVVLGICFAFLEQNSYSLMSRIVKGMSEGADSKAFSFMTFCLEGGIVLLPIAVGHLTKDGDFSKQNLLYAACLGCGAVLTSIMFVIDDQGHLNGTHDVQYLSEPLLCKKF